MTPAPIRFLFDYLSPYAYIGWTQIHALAERHGRAVEPVPVLFAALLNAHGTKGPAEVPAKRVYVFKDAFRKAHALGLGGIIPPPAHPFSPLLALRASSLELPAPERRALIDALYRATWAGGGGVEERDAVARIADSVGLAGADIVARAEQPEAKQRLRRATDDAIAAGVFGVPTLFVDGEMFWGVDSLPHVDQFLAGRDPFPHEALARWGDVPATATRTRPPREGAG